MSSFLDKKKMKNSFIFLLGFSKASVGTFFEFVDIFRYLNLFEYSVVDHFHMFRVSCELELTFINK